MSEGRDYLEWPTDFPQMWMHLTGRVGPFYSHNEKCPDRSFCMHDGRLYAIVKGSMYKRPELDWKSCYRTEPFDDEEVAADLRERHEERLAYTKENPGKPGSYPVQH